MVSKGCVNLWIWGLAVNLSHVIALSGNPAFGQSEPIEADNTLGTESSRVVRSGNIDSIEGGAVRGGNLFHSFEKFNVQELRRAYFVNPINDIKNIISRVTGGNSSEILGTLGVLNNSGITSSPNLIFSNPNGIVFGENASLDVPGSFVATTADAVQFGEQGFFSAREPQRSSLLSVEPSALFFNQISSSDIAVRSVAPAGTSTSGIEVVGLRVPDGRSLLLVGGDINFEGGQSSALGGHLELGGLKEPGSIDLKIDDKAVKLSFPDNVALANVTLKDDARASVRGDGRGNLVVNADTFNATSGGRLIAGTEKPVKGGDITVNANNFIINGLSSSGNPSGLYNQTVVDAVGSPGNIFVKTKIFDASSDARVQNSISIGAEGNAGNIEISADFLSLRDGSQIATSNFGQGDSGNIKVNADTVELIGVSANGQFPSAVSSETSGANSEGKAGNVTLNTRILNIHDAGIVSTRSFNQGKGGNLTITATELLNISGIAPSAIPNIPFFISGLYTSTQGSATAGNLKIFDTGVIKVEDGGQILASTFNQGEGGNIEINADTIELIGVSDGQFRSGLSSQTSGVDSSGKAGNIRLNSRIVNIRDGGIISTQSFSQGKGGDLTVKARESLNISGIAPSTIPNIPFFISGLYTSTQGSGIAGNLKIIDTGTIKVEDGGIILASTINQGNGGNIEIDTDTLELIGISTNGQFRSGLSSETSGVDSSAKAGNIIINTRNLNLRDGGQILASTFNQGDGGNIEINADTVDLIGVSNGQFRSGLFSENSGVDSSAKAGNVTLDSRILNIRDGGLISTQTFNQGKGGNLTVTASESLNISGISPSSLPKPNNPFFRSALVTTTVGSGSAGNIKIVDTGIIKIDNGGVISASSLNQGDGGNIEINADSLEIIGVSPNGEFRNGLFSLNTGVDSFSAAGNGVFSITVGVDSSAKAGDITLNTRNLNLRDGAVLSTQSTNEGEAGNITIENDGRLQLNSSSILTNSSESFGGAIDITAKDIHLFGNSNIRTDVPNGKGEAGNITLTANTIVALDRSDILSLAPEGQGGNIRFNTAGFFSTPLYRPTSSIDNRTILDSLDGNNQVDVNASGAVSGAITGVPDITFIENSISDLQQNPIDTNALIANSCIARSRQQESTFNITGAGGLPQRPGHTAASDYSTGEVQNLSDKIQSAEWKPGEPFLEPQGVYELPSGKLILSRECS